MWEWIKSLFRKSPTPAPVNIPKPELKPVPEKAPGAKPAEPFHPVFIVPAGFDRLHPFDVLMSVRGEKEIPGSKDNPLISHFHKHAGNLGKHDSPKHFPDEVPHCSSAWNWACDMSACYKSNNALAASWLQYNNERQGDYAEVGDLIILGTHHVTSCAKRFKFRGTNPDKTFEGFGSNQGNTIKTSLYSVSEINKKGGVQVIKALPGIRLAPIGTKALPASGNPDESTR